MRRLGRCLLLLAVCACPAAAASYQHVMVVVFENTGYDEALRQPFFKEFASRGALLTNYHAVAHPSQPNYVAMVAGTREGVEDDHNVDLPLRHLGDLLEEKGKSWKTYAEGYPGNCFLGEKRRHYARKHVPFLSFTNVQRDASRCARIVEAGQLDADIADGHLPDFAMYIPDLDDDGHDTGAEFAANWFQTRFGPLLENPAFTHGLMLVATFDEDDNQGENRVYAAVVGDGIPAGTVSDALLTHYSLLRSVEEALGAGSLGRGDANARSFAALWSPAPRPKLRHELPQPPPAPDFTR